MDHTHTHRRCTQPHENIGPFVLLGGVTSIMGIVGGRRCREGNLLFTVA